LSLFALPVSASDLTALQLGIEFFTNASEATSEAGAINTAGSNESVFAYAAKLIQSNFLISQVAMAVDSLMFGQTDSVAELTKLSTQFLPAQATVAVANGFNPTVYAAEALGLALAGGNGSSNNFATKFGSLSVADFAQETADATGVNVTAIQGFITNWIAFYTSNPDASGGLSTQLAAYGAAFGDAIGVALLNDTSAGLKTDIDLNAPTISGLVANALIDNAEGLYQVGVSLGSLSAHKALQGEAGILDLIGAAGTIDMAQQPPTIRIINYQTQATGSVTIINQNNPLTVNLEDNTIATDPTTGQTLTVTGAAGFNDSLVVSLGNTSDNTGDSILAITVTGDELFTLEALGHAGSSGLFRLNDVTGLVTLTPTLGGNEQVTISGISNIAIAGLADATGGALNVDNMTIRVINTAETLLFNPNGFNESTADNLLKFVADSGAVKLAPSIGYSTNAVTIDASTSGGLFMFSGDANFNPATSSGDVIVGAANPVGVGNGTLLGDILVGSIGNDTITSKTVNLPDFIYTNGGGDTITLAAAHTGVEHVGFFAADGFGSGGFLLASVTGAISEAISAGGGPFTELVNPGWWGISAGGASTPIDSGLFAAATGAGTSADNSTLNGFVANQDFLDFSAAAWSGLLTADQGGTLVNVGSTAGLTSDAGTAVSMGQVAPGGSISGAGTVDLIVLSQNSFLNAAAVAGALSGGSYTIQHSLLAASVDAHFLLAYAGQDGNAHIADLHLEGGAGGSTTTTTDTSVYASDIVTLVGVNIAQLAANISHVHLMT
jgi:hypothetical protein